MPGYPAFGGAAGIRMKNLAAQLYDVLHLLLLQGALILLEALCSFLQSKLRAQAFLCCASIKHQLDARRIWNGLTGMSKRVNGKRFLTWVPAAAAALNSAVGDSAVLALALQQPH